MIYPFMLICNVTTVGPVVVGIFAKAYLSQIKIMSTHIVRPELHMTG